MRLGFARNRFSGACFQGLNSFDVERFNIGRLQLYMDSERDVKSAISDEDTEYPEFGKWRVSEAALIAHRCSNFDKDNLRRYGKAGYKTASEGEKLPSAAAAAIAEAEAAEEKAFTESDKVDDIKSNKACNIPVGNLKMSDIEEEDLRLLESALYVDSGRWCKTPGFGDHDMLQRTVFHNWKAEAQRLDDGEPSVPYH